MPRSLRFDRIFPSVGRVRASSGTSKRGVFAQMDAMLSALYGAGRLDLLHAIRDHRLHPMAVFDAFRRGRLDEIPTAEGMLDFASGYRNWRESREWSKDHALSLKQSGDRLGLAGPVSELPARLAALRLTMGTKARTFNVTRSAVLAFLRDTQGRTSPLYRAVSGIPALPVKAKAVRRPQTPQGLTDAPLDADALACAWSMATTGMGPKEYWTDGWERCVGYIRVSGEKRKGRERKVPDVGRCVVPPITLSAFTQRLRKAKVGWTPYDLRRSYATWLEAAAVPRTRRKLYLGHGTTDVTDLYEWHEISAFLRSDAETLTRWITAALPHNTTNATSPITSHRRG